MRKVEKVKMRKKKEVGWEIVSDDRSGCKLYSRHHLLSVYVSTRVLLSTGIKLK